MDQAEVRPLPVLPGSISLHREGEQLVACLAGEVDAAVVGQFEDVHGAPVPIDAIDAGAVTFFTASALGLLLRFQAVSQAGGRVAVLRRSSWSVDLLLRITGLQSTVHGAATAAGAGAELSRGPLASSVAASVCGRRLAR